ncbi:MAG: hypothetical protein M3404_01835 [Actinomycetota bacterium]|nr:hypothetical protein [Actinomycetota bacterium]
MRELTTDRERDRLLPPKPRGLIGPLALGYDPQAPPYPDEDEGPDWWAINAELEARGYFDEPEVVA